MGLHKRNKSKNPALIVITFWRTKESEFHIDEDGTFSYRFSFLLIM